MLVHRCAKRLVRAGCGVGGVGHQGIRSVISSTRPKILMLDPIQLAHEELERLQREATLVPLVSVNRDAFLTDLKTTYSDISGIYRHFKGTGSINVTGRIDEELVAQLPESLRFISSNGAGYDQTDTALFLILGVLRQFNTAIEEAKAGSFHKNLPLSNDPAGKVLGILGMGGIGRALAKRARALGMVIKYHNRSRLPDHLEQGAEYVTREELISTADVLSLNLPLNTSTKGSISADVFRAMKPTAVLINTARGPIVDEKALVAALWSGEIAGAGLDVYENEPNIPEELLAHPRTLCLPHIGTLSIETQRAMEAFCIKNLLAGISTGKLENVVPEQKGHW